MIISKRISISMVLLLGFSVAVNAGTIAHWKFEGTLGTDIVSVADEISGKTVTALPGTSVYPDAELTYGGSAPFFGGNSSAYFDNPVPEGSSNTGICLMRPDDDDLDLAGLTSLTIEAFIKPITLRTAVIVRDYQTYWLHMRDDGDFNFTIGDGTNQTVLSSSPAGPVIDEWQHVAGTWDGSTMRIYIDGIEVNSASYSAGLADNSGAFGIGGIVRHSGTGGASSEGQYFNGYIDEVRISDTALLPEQFLNSDTTPIVQFQLSESQNTENITTADLAVVLSNSSPNSVTVDYSVTSGTADGNGIDYTLAAGTLTFAPLQTTPEYITININDDDLPEDNETIVVTLSNATEADLGTRAEHTYTIIDDDTIPTVEFASTSSAGSENQSPVYLTVNLSRPYKDTVSVYYAAVGGSADWGIDYILPNGMLTFDPYETSKDISVEIINDDIAENDEDIQVVLFFPTNAVLGTNQDYWYTICDAFVNSLGMEFISVEPGTFQMGSTSGDFDEEPVHNVTISQSYHMAVTEVTNAQYEQFDPNHALIDHMGFTHEPNEAVIFVSWEDANAFCTWLSDREGITYRLPTEAEWEYACRAGTTTKYYTGDTLPSEYYKNQKTEWGPVRVDLTAGQSPPNAWGLYDMHGNVEEWCYDWYGPYDSNDQTDPVGRANAVCKVTRSGSHSTVVNYLRSANRSSTIPEDKHWLIGFRVVAAELPDAQALPEIPPALHEQNVSQAVPPDIYDAPDPTIPYFYGPRKYVWIPAELSGGPLFTNHNHVPALVECPNGDFLAVWFSCISETGREMTIAAARLRYGQDEWEDASVFFDATDRNLTGSGLFCDENGKIYYFNGLSAGPAYRQSNVLIMRTSDDSGATWSKTRLINPVRGLPSQSIESIFKTSTGVILLPSDWPWHPDGSASALWASSDAGQTWQMLPGRIAGIHTPVAELNDGSLLAFGRNSTIDGMMPQSNSINFGTSWTYKASTFPPIGSGQRAVLLRLREGPLFFASFGGNGLFGCVSYDDGASWTAQRLITDDGPGRQVETMDGALFTMSATNAEPKSYLSIHQAKNGLIHLIGSRQHYVFNLKYIDAGYEPPVIDGDDLEIFSNQWLSNDPDAAANFDEAGNVDLSDYSIFADYWLEPEPANWPLNE